MENKVSIIVPIYKGEKYIERCVVSLFEQDFEAIEYIFVNDCSPDNSIKIVEETIEKYPQRKPNCKIIHHEFNQGLGQARLTGLENASSPYIIHLDNDDWCEWDMISSLYNKAIETNADIVGCDYFVNYENKELYKKENYSEDLFTNQQNLWKGSLHPGNWNKLVKRNLYYDNAIFPNSKNSVIEDYFLTARLFAVAKNIAYVPKAFLHYWQENNNSICKTIKLQEKNLKELRWCFDFLTQFLKERSIFEKYQDSFYLKMSSYFLWLNSGIYDNNVRKNILPELCKFKYIWHNDALAFRSKIRCSLYMLHLGFIGEMWLKLKKIF